MPCVIDDTRLPLLHPENMTDEQRHLYDLLTGGPRAGRSAAPDMTDDDGRLLGPFNAMLYSPVVGRPLQDLGVGVRFRTGFTGREREIAILVVAAHLRAGYEWYAHERIGRRAGLAEAELAALRTAGDPALADARELVIHRTCRALVTEGDLGDALYTEATTVLGHATLVELVTLVGYYSTLALQMRVFRTPLPDGEPDPDWGA